MSTEPDRAAALGTSTRRRRALPSFLRPPEALTNVQWKLLSALMVIGAATGYGGSVTGQTITYVADGFGSTDKEQARALAFIRADIIITLVIMRIADRVGRRRVLFATATLGPLITAICSVAPSLRAFAGMQFVARGFVTATAILLSVMLVEELPAASRAWGSSLTVGAAALGSALAVVLLPTAARWSWRYLFLVPLISLATLPALRGSIGESHRFGELRDRRNNGYRDSRWTQHLPRLVVITFWIVLMGIFITPARQFANDYLRDERGFGSGTLLLYGVSTNIPGLLGVPLGGAVSDRRGRRVTAGAGLLVYSLATAVAFLTRGPTMWIAAMVGSLAGAFALPSLSIMVTELFPTELRSRASGFSTGLNRVGGIIGFFFLGQFSDQFTIGRTLAAMSVTLVIGTLVMLFFLPETAHRELEEINPDTDGLGRIGLS